MMDQFQTGPKVYDKPQDIEDFSWVVHNFNEKQVSHTLGKNELKWILELEPNVPNATGGIDIRVLLKNYQRDGGQPPKEVNVYVDCLLQGITSGVRLKANGKTGRFGLPNDTMVWTWKKNALLFKPDEGLKISCKIFVLKPPLHGSPPSSGSPSSAVAVVRSPPPPPPASTTPKATPTSNGSATVKAPPPPPAPPKQAEEQVPNGLGRGAPSPVVIPRPLPTMSPPMVPLGPIGPGRRSPSLLNMSGPSSSSQGEGLGTLSQLPMDESSNDSTASGCGKKKRGRPRKDDPRSSTTPSPSPRRADEPPYKMYRNMRSGSQDDKNDIELEMKIRGLVALPGSTLGSMLSKDNKYRDGVVVVGGESIRVHKLVLKLHSPKLALDIEATQNNTIILSGVDPGVFKSILGWMYMGTFESYDETGIERVLDYFAFAVRYGVSGLEGFCSDYFKDGCLHLKELDPTTALRLIEVATAHDTNGFLDRVLLLVKPIYKEVKKLPKWKEMVLDPKYQIMIQRLVLLLDA